MDLIAKLSSRLTSFQRTNLAIALICPLILVILVMTTANGSAPIFTTALSLLSLLVIVWFAWKCFPLFSRPEQETTARLLDQKLGAKDRFLTLASLEKTPLQSEHALSVVATQAQVLAGALSLEKDFPFRFTREAKYSLVSSPFLVALLLFSLLQSGGQGLINLEPRLRRAEELRTVAEELELLPQELKEDLITLAELVEEEGLDSAQVDEALRETLQDIEKFEQLAPEELPPPTPPPPSESREEVAEQKQDEQKEQGEDNAAAKDQATPPSSEGKEEGKENQEQNKSGDKEDGGKSPGDKEGASEKNEQGKDGEAPGEKGKQGQEAGGESKQDQEENSAQNGKGKEGKDYEGDGVPQQGEDASGAKQGDAKNDTQEGNQGGGDGTEKKAPEKNDSSGKQGERNAELKKVKKELEDLKEEIEGKQDQSGSKEGKEDSADKPGEKPGQEKEGKEGSGKPGEQSSKEQNPGGNQTQGEKEKSERGKAEGGEKNQEPTPPEQPEETKQDQPLGDKTPGNQKDGKGKPKDGTVDSDLPSPEKSERPDRVPEPSEEAKRFGPFEGGDKGLLDELSKEHTRVEIPVEEKVTIQELGASDAKRYKNRAQARPKTGLGSEEFKKPEADVAQSDQPIPVEYRDVLR